MPTRDCTCKKRVVATAATTAAATAAATATNSANSTTATFPSHYELCILGLAFWKRIRIVFCYENFGNLWEPLLLHYFLG